MTDDHERLLSRVQPYLRAGVRLVWVQTRFGLVSLRARNDRPLAEWEVGDIHATSGVTLGELESLPD
jgi:hypothetical protein